MTVAHNERSDFMESPAPTTDVSKRNLAAFGVMVVIFLFAIDATIVSTSMPTIVGKLGGLDLYSWVFSIYMVTSALTTPIFGKLADLFSKRKLMLVGIGVFVIGSALCGAAQSMKAMIAFRAVQGLGGGAIYALSFIIVGVLFPAAQRAKMQGIISGIWGLASVFGPPAGGIIVENWSWRWIFFVNLPLSAVATALIIVGLKEGKRERHKPKLDLAGALTLLLGLLLIFYALAQSAHARHPLNALTVGFIVAGLLFLIIFYFIERRATEPILPLDLFHVRLFRSSTIVSTLSAMGVFGAITYLPVYLQGVLGLTASRTGMVLLVLSFAWTGGSLLAGQAMNRVGYRFVSAAGMSLLALGYGLFLAPLFGFEIVMTLLTAICVGMGMGMANLTTLVAAQTSVKHQRIGVATSTVMLFRTFGAAFAVSIMGTVMFGRMQNALSQLRATDRTIAASLWDKLANPHNLLEPATRAEISTSLLPSLTAALSNALWLAFLTGFVLMIVGIGSSFLMANYTPANTPRPSESAE